MKIKAYFNDWIEKNPKNSRFKHSLCEIINEIEEVSQMPIYKVNLTEYYDVICRHTEDSMFEVPQRLFKYLNEFQHYLYETDYSLNANVTLTSNKTERSNFITAYAKSISEYVVYNNDERLQHEMMRKTNYKIDNSMIAVTQQEIDQCVIYLAFNGMSADDIFDMKVSDFEFTQDQMKVKIPNKKRYLLEENSYMIRIFQKVVFTRYYAQVLENTNRTIYTKIENDWLVNTLYRMKHPERHEVFMNYYAAQQLNPIYLSKLRYYGRAVRAYTKNILNCKEQLIGLEDKDIYKLIAYILEAAVVDIKTNTSRFYYGYAIYLCVYNNNIEK